MNEKKTTVVENSNSEFRHLIKCNWSWIIAMVLTTITLLFFMILARIAPFGNNTLIKHDGFIQYLPFFSEFRYKLINGESLFYSWNMGCGMDFYLVLTYYLISPFNAIILLFDESSMVVGMTIVICLKIIFSSGTIGFYLSRKEKEVKNDIVIIAMSIAYAFSGYICAYYINLMWLDSILIFPLIILGLNKIINEGKVVLYIVTLFFSMICNYYFFYMICIFLILYFFTYRFENVKTLFKKLLTFAASSLLAACMAGIVLLPAVMGIINGSSESAYSGNFEWYGNIANLIKTQYMLTAPVIQSQFSGDANLYAGVLNLILLLLYPFVKGVNVKEKVIRIAIVLFLFISMNNSILNYIWHGFHVQRGVPNRFAIFFIFMIIEMGYETLLNLKNINLKFVILVGTIAFILPVYVYLIVDFRGVVDSKIMFLLAIFSSLLYVSIMCIALYNENTYMYCKYILSILTIIEVIITATMGLNFNKSKIIMSAIDDMARRKQSIEFIKNKKESDFYREEISHTTIDNETTYFNIHGVGVFSSTISNDVLDTLGKLGVKAGSPSYYYYSRITPSPFTDDILGVRYIHSNDSGRLERSEAKYEIIYDENGNTVIENKDVLPIGYAVNKELEYYSATDFDAAYNMNLFSVLSTEIEGPYEIINPDYDISSDFCNAYIDEKSGYLICDNFDDNKNGEYASIIMSTIIDNTGDYSLYFEGNFTGINILVNDEARMSGDLEYQLNNIGKLKKGDKLDIELVVPYDKSSYYSIPVYFSRYDHDKEMAVVEKLSENPFNVTEYDSNSIIGNVNIGAGQMLMTTIPYSENWAVTVDGKKTRPVKLMGGFLGVEMSEGDHKIEMKYTPKAFWFGLILCIVSWIMFLVYIGVAKYGKLTKPELRKS